MGIRYKYETWQKLGLKNILLDIEFRYQDICNQYTTLWKSSRDLRSGFSMDRFLCCCSTAEFQTDFYLGEIMDKVLNIYLRC